MFGLVTGQTLATLATWLLAADSDRNPAALVAVVGAGGVFAAWRGLRYWRRRWAIVDTPTSKCVTVFAGRNEVVGQAQPSSPDPLTAPVTGQGAVWFRWVLERWVRRGKSSRWETVDERTSTASFWLVDDTGRVLVWPGGAEVHAPRAFRSRAHTSGVTSLQHRGRPVAALGRRYRITEWRIDPGQRIYLLGTASMRQDTAALQFTSVDGDDSDKLLISTHSEGRMAGASLFLALAGLLAGWAAAILLPATVYNATSWESTGPEPGSPSTLDAVGGWMVLLGVVYGVGLLCAYWLRLYNRLVAVKHQAANAWSLIDIALRRRHDLIPNLVTVAQRYAEHEHEVIETVTRARAATALPVQEALPSDESLRRAGEVNVRELESSRTLLLLAESYPELKADQVFQNLAQRLTDVENQVAYARAFYNDAVTVLRDRRRTFPGILLAGAVSTPSWNLFAADQLTS